MVGSQSNVMMSEKDTKTVQCSANDCKNTIKYVPKDHPGPYYCSIECLGYGKFEEKERLNGQAR